MTTQQLESVSPESLVRIDARVRELVQLHFDAHAGSAFWVNRARELGINPARDLKSLADLEKLGPLFSHELRTNPLEHYIPRNLHDQMNDFIIGQTGGTTGPGVWTCYSRCEFHDAFVRPFVDAATQTGFPRGGAWLFIGPTGPHIIGKAARELAKAMGALQPFCIDFDPRWALKLPPGSLSRKRYTRHIVEQAMQVIASQNVNVIFATPPVLIRLADAMSAEQRAQITGVHYGGMSIDVGQLEQLQTALFPNAVHLAGYGNTLMGCCLELDTSPGRTPRYFPSGDRIIFSVLDNAGRRLPAGVRGQVRLTRLDESHLIVNLMERDEAMLCAPPSGAPASFHQLGLIEPKPLQKASGSTAEGLY